MAGMVLINTDPVKQWLLGELEGLEGNQKQTITEALAKLPPVVDIDPLDLFARETPAKPYTLASTRLAQPTATGRITSPAPVPVRPTVVDIRKSLDAANFWRTTKNEARMKAAWKGHDLSRFITEGKQRVRARCRVCERDVTIIWERETGTYSLLGPAMTEECQPV